MESDSTTEPLDITPVMALVEKWNAAQRETFGHDDEDDLDRAVDAAWGIERNLLGMQAENLRDVLAKLEIARYADRNHIDGYAIANIEADVRRLAAAQGEGTQTFDPAMWWARFTSHGGRCTIIESQRVLSGKFDPKRVYWASLIGDLADGDRPKLDAWLAENFPVAGASGDPVAALEGAANCPDETEEAQADYRAKVKALEDWQPTTPRDFVRKFLAIQRTSGHPAEEARDILEADAERLIAGEA